MSTIGTRAALVPELYVRDPEKSRAFYVDLLGFEILFDRLEEGFLFLCREGAELMLDSLRTGRSWLAAEAVVPFGRGMSLQIWTADVDTLYERVKQSGAPIFLEIEEKWYRRDDAYFGNRQFIVQDPDGFLLRFAQDLGQRS
jgi:catechol 2,3-dioxygenase-like lactoylglutathione lyase family enzyme